MRVGCLANSIIRVNEGISARCFTKRYFGSTDAIHGRTLTHLDLVGTAQILAPEWKHLSLCLGAVLHGAGSALCGNLLRFGKTLAAREEDTHHDGIAVAAKLATLLLFQGDRHQPVRLTRTRSMAAAHLTPHLMGVILGLGMAPGKNKMNLPKALRTEGIKSNHLDGEWTGVSLARWKDLIELSQCEDKSFLTPLWLSCLWEISRSKSDFLEFLLAIEKHSGLDILADDELGKALRHDENARLEWERQSFPRGDLDDALDLFPVLLDGCDVKDPLWSSTLEKVCASIAAQHAPKPAVPNGRFGHDGGEPKPDCVEVTVREVFDLLLWDETTASFDVSRLPPTANKQLVSLYNGTVPVEKQGQQWFDLLSNISSCRYLSKSSNGKNYELTPYLANVSEAMRYLLGIGGNPWACMEDVGHHCEGLRVSSRKSSFRAQMGEEMVHQETATASLAGSNYAIEMRLDKGHGISTVTHIRSDSIKVPLDTQIRMVEEARTDPSIASLLMTGYFTRGLQSFANGMVPLRLLASSYGPDRKTLDAMIKTSDIGRRKRAAKRSLIESCDCLSQSILAACAYVKAQNDHSVSLSLLLWIMDEDPTVSEDTDLSTVDVSKHTLVIEKELLSLGTDVVSLEDIRQSLRNHWAVRAHVVFAVNQLKSGDWNLLRVMKELKPREILSVVGHCLLTN